MKIRLSVLFSTLTLLLSGTAFAHIGVNGPGTANATHEAVFSVGHGCEGFDTLSIKVKIPAGVTSVRPVHGGVFGKPTIEKDANTGVISSVSWTKSEADLLPADTDYYKLTIRMKLPDAPFTTAYFPTTQTCKDPATGTVYTTEWAALEESEAEGGPEPAPAIFVLPARAKGWNKFTTTAALKDLSVFNDAEIVWAGNAAYSSNATTKGLIGTEPNTTELKEIAANTEIWVKY